MTKRILFIFISLFSLNAINAQIKFGNNVKTINPNALVEAESTNKGVLITRLSLTATSAPTPLTNHVAGMITYNTATSGDVTPGFYYNDGTKWVRIGSEGLLTKVQDTGTTNNNAFRYYNKNGDSTMIIKVHSNDIEYDSASKKLYSTVNGVKDSVILKIASSLKAGNGLTANSTNDSILLGGALNRPTTLTTTSTNTLALLGVQNSLSTRDSVLVLDSVGVVKKISKGDLNTITTLKDTSASNANAFKYYNEKNDSVTIIKVYKNDISYDSASRKLYSDVNGVKDSVVLNVSKVNAQNGINDTSGSYEFGGSLLRNTTLSTAGKSLSIATNGDSVRISGLKYGSNKDSLVTVSADGLLRKISINDLKNRVIDVTTSTSYTIQDSVDVVIYTGASNATFTLPAHKRGKTINISNFSSNSENVTITFNQPIIYDYGTTNNTQTVLNSKSNTYFFPDGIGSSTQNVITIISDGTNWYKIGN